MRESCMPRGEPTVRDRPSARPARQPHPRRLFSSKMLGIRREVIRMQERPQVQPKVTYATLAAGQTPEFTKAYDETVERVRRTLGKTHPCLIGGREVPAKESF